MFCYCLSWFEGAKKNFQTLHPWKLLWEGTFDRKWSKRPQSNWKFALCLQTNPGILTYNKISCRKLLIVFYGFESQTHRGSDGSTLLGGGCSRESTMSGLATTTTDAAVWWAGCETARGHLRSARVDKVHFAPAGTFPFMRFGVNFSLHAWFRLASETGSHWGTSLSLCASCVTLSRNPGLRMIRHTDANTEVAIKPLFWITTVYHSVESNNQGRSSSLHYSLQPTTLLYFFFLYSCPRPHKTVIKTIQHQHKISRKKGFPHSNHLAP